MFGCNTGVGAPVMYNYINQYNSSICPSTNHCKNTQLFWYFQRYLLQKAISVMKWEVPDNWDKDYFLYCLYCWGTVAIINTDKFGVIPQGCTLKGYNIFYRPAQAVISNPLLKGVIEPVIGEQCVLFKCTSDYGGIMDLVGRYANEMAIAMESLDMNIMNSKLAYVFRARNKAGAESLKKVMDQVMRGELAVFYDEKLRIQRGDQTEEPWDYFINNLRQNFIAGDVLDTLRRLEELFCTEVGIPSARSDKKERMISSEAESNDVETSTRMEMWLDGWQKSCADVKKMFSVDVSVNWRHDPSEKNVSRETSGGDSY